MTIGKKMRTLTAISDCGQLRIRGDAWNLADRPTGNAR